MRPEIVTSLTLLLTGCGGPRVVPPAMEPPSAAPETTTTPVTAAPGSAVATTARPRGHQLSVTRTTAMMAAGAPRRVTLYGGNPRAVLPACRCVAGMWQLDRGGETTTHFAGTLQAPSFNHARAAASANAGFRVTVRKTRHVMGLPADDRAALHGVLRSSGQLVLREVTGGEWEVIGFAPDALGDLFARNPRWRADPKSPPTPAPPSPLADPQADGVALAKLINDHRASLGLPRIPVSRALTAVAQAHVRDLNTNNPVTQGCNLHSWSAHGTWSACCYDASDAAARCMWAKPKEIAGYRGKGYEIAVVFTGGMSPELALAQWQDSRAHHDVMINRGIWTESSWRALGVAVEGDYGVAWFGEAADGK